ncbi:MAG: hypothetical protein RLY86_3116 [Pseudomonadota bacterium]|jgi:multidrug efflux pump subunit AcrB
MDTLFYRSPRLVALMVLVVAALGLSALLTIGRQEDPTITNLFATVVTPYPGADPARVEALVTEKIEAELREIPEIVEISSTSSAGISVVQVELSSFLPAERLEQLWSEIRDALSDARRQFPEGVLEPAFDNDRAGAFTLIAALTPAAGTESAPLSDVVLSDAVLRRYAEELQDRLRGVPETKLVRLYGAGEEEVRVTLDPDRLSALGLSVDQVSAAIARADAKVRAGQLRGDGSDLLIEVAGEITDIDRVRAIPVATGPEGTAIRVGDLGDVERTVRRPAAASAFTDGVPSVLVAARMESDRQVDVWTANARGVIDTFTAEAPASLSVRIVFDQGSYTADRLAGLGWNMAMGIALVVLVLFLSMGLRAALIVSLVIPLAALLSLAVMQWSGLVIHQMSVTGLIVALGLLVDAAIVMVDQIRQRLAAGEDRRAAVGAAVRRLAMPLLASTVTTVLAFLPMAMLPGPAGDFVGSIALAVIIMLFASLLLAVTVTPALSGWMLQGGAAGGLMADGLSFPRLSGAFAASIRWSLRRPVQSVLLSLVLPVAGFAAFPTLTAQFFPGVDRDQFYVQVALPEGTALAATERAALAAGEVIAATPGIRQVTWVVGESAPAFYYNMQADRDGSPQFAEALVTTNDPATTQRVIPDLQRRLDAALPQAQVLVRGLVQGPPVAAPVELRLVGPDLAVLRRLGEEARQLMAAVPMIAHTRADLMGGAPKLVFRLDEDKVRQAGLDLGGVARQLEAALEGATGGSLVEATEELPVRVRVGDRDRGDLDAILALTLVPVTGAAGAAHGDFPGIPLTALGDWVLEPSESPISRLNGQRINTVQAYLDHGVLPEEALQAVLERLAADPLELPPGVRLEFGGDSEERAETVRNLISTLGIVVTLTMATIVLTFMSYRLSLVATMVCVLSMGLSFLALAVFGYPFGIQALIGAIGSIGVSINAAIIVMTGLQEDPAARDGDREAMTRVVTESARHIVSTTITTVGGFLPLILAGGGFWPPFAMAIAGGVLLSAVISFYFTPPMFALVTGRRRNVPAGAVVA